MVKQFDSLEMRNARRRYAAALLKGKEANEERVLDFFETLGLYRDKDRIDEDTVYSSSAYWIERYWAASREHIAKLRKVEDDEGLYSDFEDLNDTMLKLDAEDREKPIEAVVPSEAAVNRFLVEEAHLPK